MSNQGEHDASMGEGADENREPYMVLDMDYSNLAERAVIVKVPDYEEEWKDRPGVLRTTHEAALAEAKFEVVSKLICGTTDSGLWTAQFKSGDLDIESHYVVAPLTLAAGAVSGMCLDVKAVGLSGRRTGSSAGSAGLCSRLCTKFSMSVLSAGVKYQMWCRGRH